MDKVTVINHIDYLRKLGKQSMEVSKEVAKRTTSPNFLWAMGFCSALDTVRKAIESGQLDKPDLLSFVDNDKEEWPIDRHCDDGTEIWDEINHP